MVTFFRAFLEKSSHPLIDAAKDTIETDKHFTRIVAYLSVSEVIELVDDYRVYYIEQHFPLEKEDEVACQVAAGNFDRYFQVHQGYLAWLDSLDVSGAGEAIGICDVGHVDPDHPSFFGRLSLVGVPPDLNGHSTAVAGRAGGIYASPIEPDTGSALIDPDGRLYGVGVAPSVGLVSFKKSDFPQTLSAELCFRHQAPNGEYPRILNLSLGSATKQPMTYEASEKAWDVAIRDPAPFFGQNVGLTCCFSAGNKSDDGLTRPKACKNAIVTGNLVNFRPEAGIEIVSPNIVAQTSSRGNCADGRIKPDVSMPGDYTGSAAYPRPPELGPISFWLSFFRGTSAASPMTAGTCALLSQWIRKRTGSRPSPALLKAILISSCDDTGFGGPAPNTSQGWGRVNLKGILSETSRHVFLDQTSSLSNEVPRFVGSITPANVNEAVRLVLAWTDVPAAAKNSGRTLVNSLVLRARCAGQIFHGNNFVLGASVAGGTPDSIQTAHPGKIVNNVQCVFLTGDLGTIDFEVVVDEMRGNCFAPRDPYSDGDSFSQDFAIFVRNAVISSDDESGALTELV